MACRLPLTYEHVCELALDINGTAAVVFGVNVFDDFYRLGRDVEQVGDILIACGDGEFVYSYFFIFV